MIVGSFAVAYDANEGAVDREERVCVEMEVGEGVCGGVIKEEESDIVTTVGGEDVVWMRDDLRQED